MLGSTILSINQVLTKTLKTVVINFIIVTLLASTINNGLISVSIYIEIIGCGISDI